jgi:uncharacterized protein YjlB
MESVVKMLRKSAYTQLRSNIVVETDGETARGIGSVPGDSIMISIGQVLVLPSGVQDMNLQIPVDRNLQKPNLPSKSGCAIRFFSLA